MDITQALTDAENSLRDFISYELSQRLGPDWIKQCGVTDDRLEKWEQRKAGEANSQRGG